MQTPGIAGQGGEQRKVGIQIQLIAVDLLGRQTVREWPGLLGHHLQIHEQIPDPLEGGDVLHHLVHHIVEHVSHRGRGVVAHESQHPVDHLAAIDGGTPVHDVVDKHG